MYETEGRKFLLGDPLAGSRFQVTDLPRNSATPARALSGDPRDDENTIVSQLQGLFQAFTTAWPTIIPVSFEYIHKLVRFHYQYMLLHDFLPRIIHSDVLNALKTNGQYDEEKTQVLPLEEQSVHACGVFSGRVQTRAFDGKAWLPAQ